MDFPVETPKVEPVEVGTPPPDVVGSDKDAIRAHVGRSLGLEESEYAKTYQDQLDRLIDWSMEGGSKTREEIVWSIKQLANRVGSPPIGNNWAQHLSQYAYLEMERNKLDKQLKKMSR